MRVVVDANVLVSAMISAAGPPPALLTAWTQERFELVASPALLEELRDVLARPKLRRWVSDQAATAYLAGLDHDALLIADPLPDPRPHTRPGPGRRRAQDARRLHQVDPRRHPELRTGRAGHRGSCRRGALRRPAGQQARPIRLAVELVARHQVRYTAVPIVFADTRKLAEEWTYRFLAAALVHHTPDHTEPDERPAEAP